MDIYPETIFMIDPGTKNGEIRFGPFSLSRLEFSSIVFNPPIPEPTLTADEKAADKYYQWDESAYQADNTQGWTLTDN